MKLLLPWFLGSNVLSLGMFKARLDRPLSKVVSWKLPMPTAGILELDNLCGPFQPQPFYDSMILWWLCNEAFCLLVMTCPRYLLISPLKSQHPVMGSKSSGEGLPEKGGSNKPCLAELHVLHVGEDLPALLCDQKDPTGNTCHFQWWYCWVLCRLYFAYLEIFELTSVGAVLTIRKWIIN